MSLTICMPSHRKLEGARASIESVLAFSDVTGCHVVISDNSADPRKQAAFQGYSERVTYVVADNDNPLDNLLSALSPVDTTFLMPMGDDDLIRMDARGTLLDLSSIPLDVVAIRPQTEIWNATGGVDHVEDFTIDAATAGERLLEYGQREMGNNSLYYSLFRSGPFTSLTRFFSQAHPTRGGYCDWALCFALVARGRVVHDPSIVYRYDFGRWAEQDTLDAANRSLYVAAGLPPEAEHFSALLLFIDVHVLLMSGLFPLAPSERERAVLTNSSMALASFVRSVARQPTVYDETVRYLVGLITEETHVETLFILSLMVANCLQPGLKDRYLAYYNAAVRLSPTGF